MERSPLVRNRNSRSRQVVALCGSNGSDQPSPPLAVVSRMPPRHNPGHKSADLPDSSLCSGVDSVVRSSPPSCIQAGAQSGDVSDFVDLLDLCTPLPSIPIVRSSDLPAVRLAKMMLRPSVEKSALWLMTVAVNRVTCVIDVPSGWIV